MNGKKRLIPIVVMVTLVLLGLSAIGAYVLFDNLFPKAEPVKCPDIEKITIISITQDNGNSVLVETADYGELLQNICKTEPTRMLSVNEIPSVEYDYIIEMETFKREYRYFLYVEDEQVYIESPYEGVYKSNQEFLDWVTAHFKEQHTLNE